MMISPHQIPQNLIANRSDIKAFEEEIICDICQNIIMEPTQCLQCQNTFCKKCINDWLKRSSTCPFRCKPCEIKENKLLRRLLSKITLFCPFKCGQIISYDNFTGHTTNMCSKGPFQRFSVTLNDVKQLREKVNKLKLAVKLAQMKRSVYKDTDKWNENDLKSCQIKVSKHKHPLAAMITARGGWSCDICKKYGGQNMSYYCSLCDFDCCDKCYNLEKIISTILLLSKSSG